MTKSDAQKLYLLLMGLVVVVFLPIPLLAAVALWGASAFFARRIVLANDLDRTGLATMAAGYPILLAFSIGLSATGRALGIGAVFVLALVIMALQAYGMWRLLKSIRPA